VDEAQDLGVAELRFLAAIAPRSLDALFFAGDLGQRIFQPPFSWKGIGIDVRGRTFTLRVNYRTSRSALRPTACCRKASAMLTAWRTTVRQRSLSSMARRRRC
jgi:hypothetical protein